MSNTTGSYELRRCALGAGAAVLAALACPAIARADAPQWLAMLPQVFQAQTSPTYGWSALLPLACGAVFSAIFALAIRRWLD